MYDVLIKDILKDDTTGTCTTYDSDIDMDSIETDEDDFKDDFEDNFDNDDVFDYKFKNDK